MPLLSKLSLENCIYFVFSRLVFFLSLLSKYEAMVGSAGQAGPGRAGGSGPRPTLARTPNTNSPSIHRRNSLLVSEDGAADKTADSLGRRNGLSSTSIVSWLEMAGNIANWTLDTVISCAMPVSLVTLKQCGRIVETWHSGRPEILSGPGAASLAGSAGQQWTGGNGVRGHNFTDNEHNDNMRNISLSTKLLIHVVVVSTWQVCGKFIIPAACAAVISRVWFPFDWCSQWNIF